AVAMWPSRPARRVGRLRVFVSEAGTPRTQARAFFILAEFLQPRVLFLSGAAPIELGALTRLAVESEGPLLAGRVRAREDPVLPRGEPPEDLGLERLGPDEAQARFHAGERVGAHRGALLDRKPHLVVPVDVVRSE